MSNVPVLFEETGEESPCSSAKTCLCKLKCNLAYYTATAPDFKAREPVGRLIAALATLKRLLASLWLSVPPMLPLRHTSCLHLGSF